ncbi:hypothetical protein FSP39_010291 [Pinctada imbricata]|uniref:MD-2-related lipid-recognition domain-containing protein n=1 Tax=Pinctada imbricata TaxID=66713 RepID=A0AA89BLU8_PINIB|nr:hypothetical protein FSP39_010291 [Pinctada imbricata]
MSLKLGRMNFKRCLVYSFGIFVMIFIFLYLVYFRHGAPDTILAANGRKNSYLQEVLSRDTDDDVTRSARAWQKFIDDNKYVSIGDVYNDCDDENRYWVGKSVLLPDPLRGGVTSKTFINFTLENEITEGSADFFIKVSYGSKDLYENEWDFCTMEDDEDEDERFVFCPYEPKKYSWVIERKIPGYLPNGKYYAKAWITDAEEKVFMCAEANFVL